MNKKTMKPKPKKVELHPTGTCFDDVTKWLEMQIYAGKITKFELLGTTYLITHGVCLFPDGEPYAHAWIEAGSFCISGVMWEGERSMAEFPKDYFYENFRVQRIVQYNPMQAYLEEKNHGHPGPWDPEIRSLCRDEKLKRKLKSCKKSDR